MDFLGVMLCRMPGDLLYYKERNMGKAILKRT